MNYLRYMTIGLAFTVWLSKSILLTKAIEKDKGYFELLILLLIAATNLAIAIFAIVDLVKDIL